MLGLKFDCFDILQDCRCVQRWIVAVVEEFYELFGLKRCRPNTNRRQAGYDMVNPLHKLGPVGVKQLALQANCLLLVENITDLLEESSLLIFYRRKRYHYIKIF